MIFEHIGLNQINGSLVVLDGVKGASYEEMVELRLEDGTSRAGRIVKIDGELVVIQVFEGTRGISMTTAPPCSPADPWRCRCRPRYSAECSTASADR